MDWDPAIQRKGPLMAPPRGTPPPPPPPPQQQQPSSPAVPWYEVPFASRRNIVATMLIGTAGIWVWNKKILPPVQIGQPPADFPFKLAGYTDMDPADFVYAKTPGGNWIAAAQDMRGRMYIIDQAGDLYYDSGNPDIGIYALDPQGNLFNIYMDGPKRRITPVGNIRDMKSFKVSEIAGVKLDREVNVVAMADGQMLPLPPNSGVIGPDGKFIAPGEIVEGLTTEDPQDNPFARLFAGRQRPGSASDLLNQPLEVDLNDRRSYDRQIYDQTLLEDPDSPGQPALPRGFDLQEFARQVEAEQQAKAKRKRGLF